MGRSRTVEVTLAMLAGCLVLAACGEDDNNNVRPVVAPTSTATRTATSTPTPTATASPTSTPTLPPPCPELDNESGPVVTFLGITRADDTLVDPEPDTVDGAPVYKRATGAGFRLIVEGKPGLSGAPLGDSTYREDLAGFPDLQVEVSPYPLGNGDQAVCTGGVPATDPASFDPTATNIATVNDLSCRFRDGQGFPLGVSPADACVKMEPSAEYGYVNPESTLEFCGFITNPLAFQPGDTVITVRLRDVECNPGPPARMVIRIASTS